LVFQINSVYLYVRLRTTNKEYEMKNQTDFKVGQVVTFKGALGFNVILEIKGSYALTLDLNRMAFTYRKRLSSLQNCVLPVLCYTEDEIKKFKTPPYFWNDQDIVKLIKNNSVHSVWRYNGNQKIKWI